MSTDTITDTVAERIARRYAHPGRAAYVYLFRLKLESDLTPLIPATEWVVTAWLDEGSGLSPASAALTVEHCAATRSTGLNRRHAQTATERKQQMARAIQFIVTQLDDKLIEVHLVSRALLFSPKGDREVHEQWRPASDGWYSAYQPHEDPAD